MATEFVSSLSKNVKEVPDKYVYPPLWRSEMDAPLCHDIPVIDLSLATAGDGSNKIAEQVFKALEAGLGFQVINHGISEKLMEDALGVTMELFKLPIEDKEKLIKQWKNTRTSGLYSGANDPSAKVLLWIDTLNHSSYPLDESILDSWPEKPTSYRKVISEYVSETRKLCRRIFELIAESLGVEKNYFEEKKFIESQSLRANYYPKSPDPNLTMGLPMHHDSNILTIMQQNVVGLQVINDKDGKWMQVEAFPNAFFVFPGLELQILSNGRFKAVLHQVGTNAENDRISITHFFNNTNKTVKPDKIFISNENPQKYREFSFDTFMSFRKNKTLDDVRGRQSLVELFQSSLDDFLIKD